MLHSSTLRLLLLVLVTTTTSTTANSSNNKDEQQPDINLSMVDIHNDLPSNSPRLYVVGTFQSTEAPIEPGKSYNFVAGGKEETCFLIMDKVCADIVVFDPKVDLGHHGVFWSVRSDGAYHSWDEAKWEKKASWQPVDKCQ